MTIGMDVGQNDWIERNVRFLVGNNGSLGWNNADLELTENPSKYRIINRFPCMFYGVQELLENV